MRDTVPQIPVDSLAVADVPVTPYAPQHVEHFAALADTTGVDSLAHTMTDSVPAGASLRAVVQAPVSAPMPRAGAQSPLGDSLAVGLLVGAVLFVLLSYRVGYKYFDNIFHNLFSTRRRENLFEDHTFNETSILAALITLMCVCEAFVAYAYTLMHAVVPAAAGSAMVIPAFIGVALGYYFIQLGGYFTLGYIFLDEVSRKLWLDGFKASQALLGLLLLPVVAVMVSMPQFQVTTFWLAVALFFLVRIAFISKGFRIFFDDFSSCLPFILYLCAVEIAPVVLFVRIVRLLCGFF